MANGQVNTLVIVGWNPAFTAPADLEFEANLKKVANTIYLAQELDETAAASKWVIPAAHYLESWGDATCTRRYGEHSAAHDPADPRRKDRGRTGCGNHGI